MLSEVTMSGADQSKIKRRQFLAGAAAAPAVAAVALNGSPARAQAASVPAVPNAAGEVNPPGEATPLPEGYTCGSDHMVDVLKALDIEYIASNPASTFRSLQESIINYGGNSKPEFLTALHEDSAVHYGIGYARITGKPMAALVHGVVGLQHATMAIYNAFADQTPVYVIAGNSISEWTRRPGAESAHASIDQAQMVRDFVKWDEQPPSLRDFSNAAARCYQAAVTGSPGPTLLVADADHQEEAVHPEHMEQLHVPRMGRITKVGADSGVVQEIADMLCNAENPVIVVDRFGTSMESVPLLVELAEALQAPVIDTRGRMNFPNKHPLNHTEIAGPTLRAADLVLALEARDLFGMVNNLADTVERNAVSRLRPQTRVVRLGTTTLSQRSNYGASQRYAAADIEISASAEATLPYLTEAVKRGAKASFRTRGERLRMATSGLAEATRVEAARAWEASPISTARLAAELWDQIKNDEYTIATECQFQSYWPNRLWTMNHYYNYLGTSGGFGVGYNAPSAVGAALANRALGRLTIGIVGDGDYMMQPGVIWTAAHHQIPILMIIHNNRGYHQETMHIQRMAARHNRGIDRAHIGTAINEPNIDYAAVAKGMGVFAEGPVSNPVDLGPALRRALDVVRRGEPALVDVVTQPR
jgi:thiamine pyrophosphate-dependent acetolactate synthase large subunit-like protein